MGHPAYWQCFHCDETFTVEKEAREHFGTRFTAIPACQLEDATILRTLRDLEDKVGELEVRVVALRMGVDEDEAVARFHGVSGRGVGRDPTDGNDLGHHSDDAEGGLKT